MKFVTHVKYLDIQKKGLYLTSQSHVEQLIVRDEAAVSTDVCGVVMACSTLLAISLASHQVDQNTVSFITDISADRFWCSETFLCISSFSPGFCIFPHSCTEYIHDCQNKYLGRHFISFADDSDAVSSRMRLDSAVGGFVSWCNIFKKLTACFQNTPSTIW